jgi:hypothetical protein
MKVIISQTSADSIIVIEDITSIEMAVKVGRMDFEFSGDKYRVIEIGSTTLTPTVNGHVTGLTFDPTTKALNVLDASSNSVYGTSSDRKTVLVKVDFNNSTITVYE